MSFLQENIFIKNINLRYIQEFLHDKSETWYELFLELLIHYCKLSFRPVLRCSLQEMSRIADVSRECQCTRIVLLISKPSMTLGTSPRTLRTQRCFHRASMKRWTREAWGGHISSRSLPSSKRKRRQLNISREPRTGRTDGRKGDPEW